MQIEPNGMGDEKMREWGWNLNRVEEMHVIWVNTFVHSNNNNGYKTSGLIGISE